MSARPHGGIGSVGPRGGCRGGGGGGGRGNASRRRNRRRNRNPLSLTVFLAVPPDFRGAIIGRQGSVLKDIQESSGAVVKIPPAGRNGRIKVMGVEDSLLEACRRVALAVATNLQQPQAHDDEWLDCTIDAGTLGRLVGKLYLPGPLVGGSTSTLLCRATAIDPTMGIAYVAHSIHVPMNSSLGTNEISQEDVEVTIDNFFFARGEGLGNDMVVSASMKNDCVYVSGLDVNNSGIVNAVVEEIKKLVSHTVAKAEEDGPDTVIGRATGTS